MELFLPLIEGEQPEACQQLTKVTRLLIVAWSTAARTQDWPLQTATELMAASDFLVHSLLQEVAQVTAALRTNFSLIEQAQDMKISLIEDIALTISVAHAVQSGRPLGESDDMAVDTDAVPETPEDGEVLCLCPMFCAGPHKSVAV